jgi:hypothetical protein
MSERRGEAMTVRSFVGEGLHRLPLRVHRAIPAANRADLRQWLGRFEPQEMGFPSSPPACPPGEVVGPPDFVGVGVPFGGAAWWYRLMVAHPGISLPSPMGMDRHFLDHFSTREFGPREIEHYHRLFPRPIGAITGEWTPGYMTCPWVAPVLADAAPRAKILIMLRDPVARVQRALDHSIKSGLAVTGEVMAGLIENGHYPSMIRRMLEFFPPDQVLILQVEKCQADPSTHWEATQRFLGIPPKSASFGPPPQVFAGTTMHPEVRKRLGELYAPDVDQLAELVPGFDGSVWPMHNVNDR